MNEAGWRQALRQASFSGVNWKAPASSSTDGAIAQSFAVSHPLEETSACNPASPRKATSPNADHTSAYAPRNAASDARRSGARADATENMRTSGRLDGTIIAAIITCQASRNSG